MTNYLLFLFQVRGEQTHSKKVIFSETNSIQFSRLSDICVNIFLSFRTESKDEIIQSERILTLDIILLLLSQAGGAGGYGGGSGGSAPSKPKASYKVLYLPVIPVKTQSKSQGGNGGGYGGAAAAAPAAGGYGGGASSGGSGGYGGAAAAAPAAKGGSSAGGYGGGSQVRIYCAQIQIWNTDFPGFPNYLGWIRRWCRCRWQRILVRIRW